MTPVIHKVFAYITHRNRLLVFRHTDFPEQASGPSRDGDDEC
jgi:hypothetical protein